MTAAGGTGRGAGKLAQTVTTGLRQLGTNVTQPAKGLVLPFV